MMMRFGNYMIRDFQMEDAPAIARYANNRKIWRNLRDFFPSPYHLEDAVNFIQRALEPESRSAFAIATDQEAIGSIGIMPGKDIHRFTAEMGYWIGEPFWGKGIAAQAVKALAQYAVTELKFHRIYAEPFTTNPASAKVLEKAGFVREGILRANVFKEGKVLDQYMYAYVKT